MDLLSYKLQNAFMEIFTAEIQETLTKLLLDAYDMRAEAFEQSALLKNTQIGQGLKAHVLRAAIEKVSMLYCVKEFLPWSFEIQKNMAGNCKHIEFKNNDSRIYFSRVQNEEMKPKSVKYRPDIEINMFTESIPPIDTFLITYGESRINNRKFAGVGIPGTDSWLYFKLLDLVSAEKQREKEAATITSDDKDKLLADLLEEINSDEWNDANDEKEV